MPARAGAPRIHLLGYSKRKSVIGRLGGRARISESQKGLDGSWQELLGAGWGWQVKAGEGG